MGMFLVTNTEAKTSKGTNRLIVAAETAADARVFAASHFSGDSDWSGSTATALTEQTLDASAAMLGWSMNINITGGAAQTVPVDVTVTGTGTDDLDALAALAVIALNATTDIANSAYAAPALTCASIADGIGDATVNVTVFPPSGHTLADLSSILVASQVHEGIAAAVLTVDLVADTEALPEVLAEV